MIYTRFRPAFVAVFFAAALALPVEAAAQPRDARPKPAPVEQVQAPAVPEPAQDATPAQASLGLNQNARETRAQFYKVLEQYPPALGRILRLDPTLLNNQAYMSSYPRVAAFVAQNPDIPRNPAFYLERYDEHYGAGEPLDTRRQSLRMWEDVLSFLGAFAVFAVVTFALFSLTKYVVEYRRWHRISKINSEVHNKILDRFGSNEELLAYIDSPAGRRFLEATPIAPSTVTPRMAAPFGRILLSVQLGVLLIAVAIGLWLVSNRTIEEVQQLLMALSVLGFSLGIGCIVSAGASYVLSRRLGLLQDTAIPPPQSAS